MPAPITITSTNVVITPLFGMRHKETRHSYHKGIRSQIEHERGLYPVQDLVRFLQDASRTNLFERRQATDLYQLVGYQFGCIHGGVLTPSRTFRADVATLAAFEENRDAVRGYQAGRHYFFYEASVDERTLIDDQLIERFQELTGEAPTWHDSEEVWFFTVGCLLGELSGHLFPQSEQERQQWREEEEAFMREYRAAHYPDM